MAVKRYLHQNVKQFLENRMVFVGGPRQVGKTTMALGFLKPGSVDNPAYLNWDDIKSRSQIRKGELPDSKVVVLDEIHKFKSWRGLIKGFYDKRKDFQKFIVTGSARLDYYRRGGDSLLGRYRYLRLHPLSISELKIKSKKDLEQLLIFGGFPEPFFSGRESELKLWHQERLYRIVNDDIRDLERLREYSTIELLAENLQSKVGSILSLNSLAEDLSVNFNTIKNWIGILEKVYYCFRISPYGAPKIRAVKKEQKLYLWDWGSVESAGARFENLVASHLLKYCHFLEDTQGEKMELRFLRDRDRREVDFVVLRNKKPEFAVECKSGEKSLSRHIKYFSERTAIPRFYQVHLGEKKYRVDKKTFVMPFIEFCSKYGI